MKTTLSIGIVMVLLLACVGAVSAALIPNGGFEFPTPGGSWSTYQNGYSGLVWKVEQGIGAPAGITPTLEIQKQGAFSPALAPFEGTQFAELDSYANANISQMISVTAGNTYTISFAQACRPD